MLPQDLPLQKAIRTGQEVTDEIEFVYPDGTVRTIYGKAVPLYAPNGGVRGAIACFAEITALKQSEHEREQLLQRERFAREEAEQANRLKDQFLAVLSHELRSPLNPILGWAKLLQTRSFDAAKTAQALATIERNALLQTQLVDDLLDLAKILRGKLHLHPVPVYLAGVVEAAVETVKTSAAAKTIALKLDLEPTIQVAGDTARLQQIVCNLLSNAVKFTPSGGQVTVTLQSVDDQAEISVSDTGIGISPEFLPHLFESFRQEDISITRKHGGLGLGLAIVRQLVDIHGGTITARSPGEGQGATFRVRLPQLSVEASTDPAAALPKADLDLSGIRVFSVDDSADTREFLTVLLEQYGANVITAGSASEALATIRTLHADVLISDIGMPDMDGYKLIRRVRALPPDQGGDIPAIALTAYARDEDQQQSLASGYQRHLSKPLDLEKLVQAVVELTQARS
ncbi:MAG: response regulator [Nodosilinea sp. WJT8-NPBG4]|nr:response regulator [Nodosilinea sp. WJT8-NPBG4]